MWHWGKDTGEREQRGTNISGQSWAGCTVNHNLGEKKFLRSFDKCLIIDYSFISFLSFLDTSVMICIIS